MSHLADDELVEALGPDATPRATAHLAECEGCRRQAEDLRATLAAVQSVDVPEPSPLFWSSFAARVSEATASVVPGRAPWRRHHGLEIRWTWSLAAAVIVIAAAATLVLRPGARMDPPNAVTAAESAIALSPAAQEPGALDEESPWALVADASDGMDWDVVFAAGLGPAPGSAERAVSQLSDRERLELVRLLKAELAGSSL
jgi:hypothetical protein